ncbi:MAG: Dabb family protein, partial [Acidimicrobiia bacterium]
MLVRVEKACPGFGVLVRRYCPGGRGSNRGGAVFRHVVMVKFRDDATDEQKQALRDGLATMPEQIPEVRA